MAGFGDYEHDVVFDFDVASRLASAFTDGAEEVEDYGEDALVAREVGGAEFKGFYASVFDHNMVTCSNDATSLVEALRGAADCVEFLSDEARKENERRRLVREYLARHDNWWEKGWDWLFGQEPPPPFSPEVLPSKNIPSVTVDNRDDQASAPVATGGGGVCSAVPEKLERASSILSKAQDNLSTLNSFSGLIAEFDSKCRYGRLDAGNIVSVTQRWKELNSNDINWLTTVATAFRQAGGTGEVSVLSDWALSEALRQSNVNESRDNLDITSPTLSGIDRDTGYVEDPVNTATGNFVEPETDLAFDGASGSLALGRMYNSITALTQSKGGEDTPGVGVFGVGWASVLDQHLIVSEEEAVWVGADGRHTIFPVIASKDAGYSDSQTLPDGGLRARGDNYWITQCQVSDTTLAGWLPVSAGDVWLVSDNQGTQWVFDQAGRWLGVGSRPGDAVIVEHDDAGRVFGLVHSRGRRINIEYADGLVAVALSSDGRRVEYSYDQEQRLVQARSVGGGVRQYVYNDAGLIEKVISGAGVVECVNTYDRHGRVVSQVSEFGRATRFAYLPGNVTAVSDMGGGRSNTWIADSKGRTVGIIDSDGERQSMAYDSHGNLVMSRDRAGDVTVNFYDERGRLTRTVLPTKAEIQYEWDERDRLTLMVAGNGSTVSYKYASEIDRDPSEIVDPAGGITRLKWSDSGLLESVTDPEGVRVEFGYDEYGDLVSSTNANGDTARLERDAAGRVVKAITPLGYATRFTYDASGNLVRRVDPDGAVYTYACDTAGRVSSITAPDGGVTAREYGPHGHVTKTTDPLGRVVERGFDDLGNVNMLRLPDGAQWLFNHNGLSRLTSVVDPGGGRWEYDYNTTGELVATTDPTGIKQQITGRASAGKISSISGDGTPDGAIEFDPYGRPVKAIDAAGGSELIVYDACGRPIELVDANGGLTKIRRDLTGRVITHTTPQGRVTRYTYDGCGRLETITDPNGGMSRFVYDADSRVIKRVSPAGEETTYNYDPMGRLISAHVPGVGRIERGYDKCGRLAYSRDLATGVRRFKYDVAGQLIQVTNGVGGKTRYAYDERGRVIAITDPLGNTTRRTYNELDKVTSVTDPLGRTTTATYDQAGRQLTQTDPDGVTLSFEYDGNGVRCATYADGRLLTRTERDLVNRSIRLIDHTNPTDTKPLTHTLTYDRLGRLIAKTLDSPNHTDPAKRSRTSRWTYDKDGERTTYTTPNGQTTTYTHNTAGQVTSITHPLLGTVKFTHDKAGRIRSSSHNGITHQWAYHDGHITTHRYQAGPTQPQDVTRIERDTWGRITTIKTHNETVTYTYDQAGQLTHLHSSRGIQRCWEYDQAGHLTCQTITSPTEGGNTTTTTVDYAYDEASQLTETTTITSTGVETTNYFYTEAGRRDGSVSTDGTTTSYDWDTRGWLTNTTTTNSQDQAISVDTHVDGLGQLATINHNTYLEWDYTSAIPTLTSVNDTNIIGLPGGDYLGAPHTTGDQGWRPNTPTNPIDPSGLAGLQQAQASNGLGIDPLAGVTTQLPPGVTLTPGAGLNINGHQYSGARLYDPTTHAFLTPDPLANPTPGTLWETNPYNHTANNPLTFSDPTGYKPVTDTQLAAYTQTIDTQGALSHAWQWTKNNWQYVAAGAVGVGSVALLFTPLAPLGAAALVGGVASAGFSAGAQYLFTGSVDPKQIALDFAIGGAGGFTGAGVGVGLTRHGVTATRTLLASGGTEGAVSGALGYATGPGPHTPLGYLQAVTFGGATGTLGGKTGANRTLKHATPAPLATEEVARRLPYPGSIREADMLHLRLAFEEGRLAPNGIAIAGNGTNTPIKDIDRLIRDYGGRPENWSKMTSTGHRFPGGSIAEVHWYENTITNIRYEPKLKVDNIALEVP